MKSFIVLLIINLFLISFSFAQNKTLSIGNMLPEDAISAIHGIKDSTFKSVDFKRKLTILDFWATWCGPCVGMIPKIDSLQKEFDGKIQFVPITQENGQVVSAFLKKFKNANHFSFSSLTNDTLLNAHFPHSSIPYYVWIDENSKIIATTEASEITAEKIQAVLTDGKFKLNFTVGENNKRLNNKNPIFVLSMPFLNDKDSVKLQPIEQQAIKFQSILSGYEQDAELHQGLDSNHFEATNTPIINFYRIYFGATQYKYFTFEFWGKARCIIEIKDTTLRNKISSDLTGMRYVEWLKANGYCYELIWKGVKDWKVKYRLLNDDMERYFAEPLGFTANIEKRLVPCHVLVMQNKNKLKTIGGKPMETHDAFSYHQQNMLLNQFFNRLTVFWQGSEMPLINETKYEGNVDLDLNCKMTDIDAVNKELVKYGLKFIKENRLADVLVFRDKK